MTKMFVSAQKFTGLATVVMLAVIPASMMGVALLSA